MIVARCSQPNAASDRIWTESRVAILNNRRDGGGGWGVKEGLKWIEGERCEGIRVGRCEGVKWEGERSKEVERKTVSRRTQPSR
jgi:hypothetical protein